MVSPKKLLRLAQKWQKFAAAKRTRISWPKPVTTKGHFVVYTMDERRFMIPLAYLKSEILKQLFEMAQEEFGLTSDSPITLPCDSTFMEYCISILRRHATEEIERALILSLGSCRSSSSSCLQQDLTNNQLLIQSF